jgi:hypothetical protein
VAIGTPTSFGSGSTGSNANHLTFTTTANIVAGNLLVIAISASAYDESQTGVVSSISDGTNSYTKGITGDANNSGDFVDAEIWYCQNASAVSSGATVTIDFTASVSGVYPGIVARGVQVSGVATTGAFDSASAVSSTPSGATNSPSVTSGTLSVANEIVFGVVCTQFGTFTEASGWTTIDKTTTGGYTAIDFAYKIVSATTAQTYNPTITNSTPYYVAAVIAGFEAPSGGNTYSLSCGEGSFAFTGKTLTTNIGRVLSLSEGSFAFTGKALTENISRQMSLAAGSFVFTGKPLTENIGRVLSLGEGSFAFTGKTLTAAIGRVFLLGEGSFAFTGEPMTFAVALSLLAQAGTFVFTGSAAGLSLVRAGQSTLSYAKQFLATMGSLMGIPGDPPS